MCAERMRLGRDPPHRHPPPTPAQAGPPGGSAGMAQFLQRSPVGNPLPHPFRRHQLALRPRGLGPGSHELDEAELHALRCGQLQQPGNVLPPPGAEEHRIDLQRFQARLARCPEAGQRILQAAAPGQQGVAAGIKGIQGHTHPRQPCPGQLLCQPGKACAVGGHGDLGDPWNTGKLPDQGGQPLSDQGFSAGQLHPPHGQLSRKPSHHGRQALQPGQPPALVEGNATGRHAVPAPQVTPVGDGKPQQERPRRRSPLGVTRGGLALGKPTPLFHVRLLSKPGGRAVSSPTLGAPGHFRPRPPPPVPWPEALRHGRSETPSIISCGPPARPSAGKGVGALEPASLRSLRGRGPRPAAPPPLRAGRSERRSQPAGPHRAPAGPGSSPGRPRPGRGSRARESRGRWRPRPPRAAPPGGTPSAGRG